MNILITCPDPRSPFIQKQKEILGDFGHKCSILSPTGSHDPDENESRSILDYFKFYIELLRLDSAKYDLIYSNFGLTAVPSILSAKRPIVVSLWGSDIEGKYGPVVKPVCKKADEIIVFTNSMNKKVGYDTNLVPFAIDLELFRPIEKKVARDKIGWDQDRNVALFPYSKKRNVKNYPLAKRLVSESDVDVELKSVSGVDYEEMPFYICASDLLLVTSKREGGPMVVKEAMACNIPVVSRDVGDVEHRLSQVSNSFYSNEEDALIDAIEYLIREKPQIESRTVAQQWSMEKMGKNLINVFETAVEKRQ